MKKNAVDRLIVESDHIRYTPTSLNLANRKNIQLFIDILREDSAISLRDCYTEVFFNVTHRAAGHAQYPDGDQIRLVKLSSVAFFINIG